tara:strand:+ start:1271 stop:1468 length:198 start_codon:yes stop_codon:yes gene_type:complete
MYLPFTTEQEAIDRSRFEAFNRGCVPPTLYWWSKPTEENGEYFLNVGDGDGLSDEEIARCVASIP